VHCLVGIQIDRRPHFTAIVYDQVKLVLRPNFELVSRHTRALDNFARLKETRKGIKKPPVSKAKLKDLTNVSS
jgi:hypothetical protein